MRVQLAKIWGLTLGDVDQLTQRQITWLNNEARRQNQEKH